MSSCSNLCARERAPAGRKGQLQSRTKVLIHQGSSPLPLTYNADNQVILSLFVEKNATFSSIDYGGWGVHDLAQLSQLLLTGIVEEVNKRDTVT